MEHVTGRVRGFNRYYTQRIGVLTDRYLGQRPLGEARLLFEIGESADVSAVRARLGLDSGYLSRLLRSLQRQGLITLSPHPGDARARIATLTDAGKRAAAEIDTRAEQTAADLIEPLTPDQQRRLADAMDEVQRLLRLAAITIHPVAAGSASGRSCLLAYAEELSHRFPEGYSAADLVDPAELEPPHGMFLVASDETGDVGCVGVRTLAPGVGEIRHMWVHPRARRTGLGRRILRDLETRAVEMGFTELRLGTHEALPEAIAMYQALGYAEIPAYSDEAHNQRFFSKTLLA
jgi:DNA-binding MarR family transcriptional regulator/N-acetylglutamate synthase-like GNAT family acetyltransferase